ncbi:MAG: copper resistance system multicopper oxidase [Sulfurovum sp.]|nr:copper resistance system multicopper oxidase [Sulfurovum sp.]MCB4748631.1 copper resistance system multicopper oxidase [Sulfurovum sp.]MCB4752893.1 copper resistance system multicopper oxidase [Sulfurovum sp.]MCB4761998.1 copper resistance system multicopper oxidase [Sulfurovum sp.]MCB4775081.1 copper resistance system multicopper oxidase [Sulfurovum sp.]
MLRRTFIKGVTTASIAGVAGIKLQASIPHKTPSRKTILEGNEFFLEIDYTTVNKTGKPTIATTINGQIPGPTLVWKEGETVTIHVTNYLKKSSSIHWHGIILPYKMDGVPGVSYEGIAPGETFTYRFKVHQHGTFWYHSHSGYQEQTGMYGAIVIKPKHKEPFHYDREHTILLSDWSDEKPDSIYRKLKLLSNYYNFNQKTIGDFFSEVKQKGFSKALSDRKMWNHMRMSDRDLSDVTGYTYTYLMHGNNPATQFKALFKKGEKVRLRFINGAAMSFFDIRIPELTMTVVAADGNHIKPIRVDEFRIGVAETYDVIVEPSSVKAYAIFAQSIDRSGYALGSLTPSNSLLSKAPRMDNPQALTMVDMGMKMSMKSHKKMSMGMKKYRWEEMETQKYPITPLPMAKGPQTTMVATDPKYRLEDPGVGLRNNGRRVLTYADLKNRYSTIDAPKPNREIVLHLTGNMERYMWSINGIKYADAKPLIFHYGERLRITLINDTMMNHPMHLHGLWSDLETGDDNHLVRKHTVIVQPGSKISYRVTVDAKGAWVYHCHLLYHMAGMFRKVVVI